MASHPTHNSMKQQGHRDHAEQLRHHAGSVKNEIKSSVMKAVHEHESKDHPGTPKTKIKLKDGGHVEGKKGHTRLDRASGGRANSKSHGKGKSGNHVNIVVAPGGGAGAHPPGGGLPLPAGAAQMPPPRPPMAGPPPGGPPMGPPPGPPGMPPRPPMGPPVGAGTPGMGMMPRASGGRVHLTGGSGGGEGRLEKTKAAKSESLGEMKPMTEEFDGKKLKKS